MKPSPQALLEASKEAGTLVTGNSQELQREESPPNENTANISWGILSLIHLRWVSCLPIPPLAIYFLGYFHEQHVCSSVTKQKLFLTARQKCNRGKERKKKNLACNWRQVERCSHFEILLLVKCLWNIFHKRVMQLGQQLWSFSSPVIYSLVLGCFPPREGHMKMS